MSEDKNDSDYDLALTCAIARTTPPPGTDAHAVLRANVATFGNSYAPTTNEAINGITFTTHVDPPSASAPSKPTSLKEEMAGLAICIALFGSIYLYDQYRHTRTAQPNTAGPTQVKSEKAPAKPVPQDPRVQKYIDEANAKAAARSAAKEITPAKAPAQAAATSMSLYTYPGDAGKAWTTVPKDAEVRLKGRVWRKDWVEAEIEITKPGNLRLTTKGYIKIQDLVARDKIYKRLTESIPPLLDPKTHKSEYFAGPSP